MKAELRKQLGTDPAQSRDFGRIVNSKNFDRLSALMNAGKIVEGGSKSRDTLYIAPAIIPGLSWNDPVMHEEIFGPILPILTFTNLDQAIAEVRRRDKPLSAYLYSDSAAAKGKFLELSFG